MYYKTLHYINERYGNIFKSKGGAKYARAAQASGIRNFGWYSSLKDVAVAGVFNLPNKTPMESTYCANMWDFMKYLSVNKAENDYQFEVANQK